MGSIDIQRFNAHGDHEPVRSGPACRQAGPSRPKLLQKRSSAGGDTLPAGRQACPLQGLIHGQMLKTAFPGPLVSLGSARFAGCIRFYA